MAQKYTAVVRVVDLNELAVPPGNRLEILRGERAGQYSIRVNDQQDWDLWHALHSKGAAEIERLEPLRRQA